MALQGEAGVVAVHPRAVVAHADQYLPAIFQLDAHAARPGIERILDELLDHRCRPLDDFPGGDLVGDLIGENLHPRARHQAHNPAISVFRTQP